jgi:hypothetical protein
MAFGAQNYPYGYFLQYAVGMVGISAWSQL